MANEATVNSILQIRNGNLIETVGGTHRETVTGIKGPVPGALLVPLTGVEVVLAELTEPGLCNIRNLGRASGSGDLDSDYLEVGIRDPGLNVFYPFMEVLAGHDYTFRLSRNLSEEYDATGTGTTATNNQLWLKAHGAPLNVQVKAYEK